MAPSNGGSKLVREKFSANEMVAATQQTTTVPMPLPALTVEQNRPGDNTGVLWVRIGCEYKNFSDPSTLKVGYEELRAGFVPGVDPRCKEAYLTDAEFEAVLGFPRARRRFSNARCLKHSTRAALDRAWPAARTGHV